MKIIKRQFKPISGAPPPPPQNARRSANLTNQYREAKSVERMYCRAVDDVISTTAASLPVEFLLRHKMFQNVQRKAVLKLQLVIAQIRLRILRHRFCIWKIFLENMNRVEKSNAFGIVVRVISTYLKMRKRKKIEAEKTALESFEKEFEQKAKDDFIKAAITIQCIWRMVAMRRYYILHSQLYHRAIYRIQKQWRLFCRLCKGGKLLFQIVEIMQIRLRAVSKLQRIYRGFLGRMRARVMWTVRHRLSEQLKYETRDGIFKVYFEQHGAALRLQRWARLMGWQMRAKLKRRHRLHLKIIEAKATVIQRVFRGHCGRNRARTIANKQRVSLFEKKKQTSVVKIQALARGYIYRLKLKAKFAEKAQGKSNYLAFLRKSSTKVMASRRNISHQNKRDYARRGGISFEHLRIGDERNIKLLGKSAREIQIAWRSYCTRRLLRRILFRRRIIFVRRLQHWVRRVRSWRRLAKTLYRLIPFIKLKLRQRNKVGFAARKIQTCWRSYNARRRLERRRTASFTIVRILARVLRSRRKRRKAQYHRAISEQRATGKEMFYRTLQYRRIEEFWRGSQRKGKGSHELKSLFTLLGPQGMLESGRLLKLLKSVPDLIDKSFDVNQIEIMFAKLRKPPEKRLTYPQMLDLLYEMACTKYMNLRPAKKLPKGVRSESPTSRSQQFATQWLSRQKDSLATQQRASAVVTRGASDAGTNEKTPIDDVEFVYGRLRNRSALVVCFVDQYLAPTKAFRECVEAQQLESSAEIARRAVTAAALRLQIFCRNRMLAKLTWKIGLSLQEEYAQYRRVLSAITLQRVYRGWKCRRRDVRFAQLKYVKCIDPDSGFPYWFNNVSEQSFWEKPFLLREFDCGEAVMMPPLAEMCSTNCQNDDCGRSASCYCNDCDGLLCSVCSHSIHSEGRRKMHEIIKLTHCAQCGFQLATRHCKSCGDYYCDSCYSWLHRRGRMKLHTGAWVTDRCDVCQSRAAWWVQQDPAQGYKATVYCRVCFTDSFGNESDPNEIENIFPLHYSGPAVQEYIMNRRLQEERKSAEVKIQRMRILDLAKRKTVSALRIQKLFRGHLARKKMSDWIEERRRFLQLRKLDEEVRKRLLHRTLVAIGMGQSLPSDTAMEYTMRLFPWYMKATVQDCIGRDWSMAAAMAGWKQEHQRMTFREGFHAFGRMQSAEMLKSRLQKKLKKKVQQSTLARQEYLKIRALSASHVVIREMKVSSERAESEADAARAELERAEMDLKEAQDDWLTYRNGASGPLRRYVKERIVNGINLEISGRLVSGSAVLRIKNVDRRRWLTSTHPECFLVIDGTTYRLLSGDMFSESLITASVSDSVQGSIVTGTHPEAVGGIDSVGIGSAGNYAGSQQPEMEEHENTKNAGEDVLDEFCVLMDRVWPLESQSDVPLHRLVTKPPLSRAVFKTRRNLQLSYPVQVGIRATVQSFHDLAQTCRRNADLYDEEGGTARRLIALAKGLETRRDKLLKSCSQPVSLITKEKKPPVTMFDRYKSLVALIQEKYQKMQERRRYRKAVEAIPPFYRWEQSTTKMEIECVLELDDGTQPKTLGTFHMDPDATCVVMREYVERSFREQLNETVGEDFCFTTKAGGGGDTLLRTEEASSWAIDFLNPKDAAVHDELDDENNLDFKREEEMLKVLHVAVIIRDRGTIGTGSASMIPEFPPYNAPTLLI